MEVALSDAGTEFSNCAAGFGASTRNEVLERRHMHQCILNQGEGLRKV